MVRNWEVENRREAEKLMQNEKKEAEKGGRETAGEERKERQKNGTRRVMRRKMGRWTKQIEGGKKRDNAEENGKVKEGINRVIHLKKKD